MSTETELFEAIRAGDFEGVKMLVSAEPNELMVLAALKPGIAPPPVGANWRLELESPSEASGYAVRVYRRSE